MEIILPKISWKIQLLVARHKELFHPKIFQSLDYIQQYKIYLFVHYDQKATLKPLYMMISHISYVKVYRAGVDLFVDTQKESASLTMFGVDYYDQLKTSIDTPILASQALSIAIKNGPIKGYETNPTDIDAELLFVPFEKEKESLKIPLCWKISFTTKYPVGQWQVFVDAQTGEIHSFHNEVRFFSGTLQATHDERNPSSDLIISPLEDPKISTDTDTVYTDSNGLSAMEEDSTIDEDVLLRGLHTRIFNPRGTEVLLNINTEETAEM